jgi:hypothetical protein
MKLIGIYKITNIITLDFYIGQSRNLKQRWAEHKTQLRHNKHPNAHLQNAWNKYEEDSFKFTIYEIHKTIDKLTSRENELIATLKPHYNIVQYTEDRIIIISEETKRKIGAASKRKFIEHPELLQKWIDRRKNTPVWNKGKTGIYSEETIQKMKEVAKKRGIGGVAHLFTEEMIKIKEEKRYKRKIEGVHSITGDKIYFNSLQEAENFLNKGNKSNICANIITGIKNNKIRYGYYFKYTESN